MGSHKKECPFESRHGCFHSSEEKIEKKHTKLPITQRKQDNRKKNIRISSFLIFYLFSSWKFGKKNLDRVVGKTFRESTKSEGEIHLKNDE